MTRYTGLGPPPIRQPSPAISFNSPWRDKSIAGPPSLSSIAPVLWPMPEAEQAPPWAYVRHIFSGSSLCSDLREHRQGIAPHRTHTNLKSPTTSNSTPNAPGATHAHHAEPLLRSRWATRSPKTPITALIADESTTTRTTFTLRPSAFHMVTVESPFLQESETRPTIIMSIHHAPPSGPKGASGSAPSRSIEIAMP